MLETALPRRYVDLVPPPPKPPAIPPTAIGPGPDPGLLTRQEAATVARVSIKQIGIWKKRYGAPGSVPHFPWVPMGIREWRVHAELFKIFLADLAHQGLVGT